MDRLLSVKLADGTVAAAVNDPQMGATVEGLINVVNGALLADYRNTAWGKPSDAAGFSLRYRMAGREYDASTGLYYMRARYYDPQVGRFLSEDPVGMEGGLSLYAYAGNDPINASDPSGLGPEDFDPRYGDFVVGATVCQRNRHLQISRTYVDGVYVGQREHVVLDPGYTCTYPAGRGTVGSSGGGGRGSQRIGSGRSPQQCFDESTAPMRTTVARVFATLGIATSGAFAAGGKFHAVRAAAYDRAAADAFARAQLAPGLHSPGPELEQEIRKADARMSRGRATANAAASVTIIVATAGFFASYFATTSVICDIAPESL